MLTTLILTLCDRAGLDHAWKLVRRAAGHEQKEGALERIFVISHGDRRAPRSDLVLRDPGPGLVAVLAAGELQQGPRRSGA